MDSVQQKSRLHPLVAGAAAAAIIASALGVAAVGGYLPGSKAGQAEPSPLPRKATRVARACTECGVVLGVREETVMGKGTGVGAVVGGIAGHQIERSARSTKRYEISVRMPDGSVKTALQGEPPAWRPGDKVRLHDGVVKPL